MRVSKGALVAGGVGIAAAGTIVVRNRSRRKHTESSIATMPEETVILETDKSGEPTMTVITEEAPEGTPLSS